MEEQDKSKVDIEIESIEAELMELGYPPMKEPFKAIGWLLATLAMERIQNRGEEIY